MMASDKHKDAEHWNRRFAVECNNRAWDLAVQDRSPEQDVEMLNAAHASAFHWSRVGEEVNRMRATMLLAEVCALLGLGVKALEHAQAMRDFFLGRETPDWETAFVHVIYAHAAHAAGETSDYESLYDEAVKAVDAIESPADREVVEATFRFVPKP